MKSKKKGFSNVLSFFLSAIVFSFALSGCLQHDDKYSSATEALFKKEPLLKDVLSVVRKDDTVKLKELLSGKAKHLLNYQEKDTGITLFTVAIESGHYSSAKIFAELGADPNLQSKNDGESAMIAAANKLDTSVYLKLLLNYGGDVNAEAKSQTYRFKTPLMAAAESGRLENVKLLVEAGANINFTDGVSPMCETPAYMTALENMGQSMQILKYLIIDKGADFRKGYTVVQGTGDTLYLVNLLRDMLYDIGSDDYKVKMEIVQYMKDRGVDYWKTPIPEIYKKQYSKEYLEKY